MAQSARAAAQPPRRVLLTNDDGPDAAGSPFLRHWIEHVQRVLKWNCCVCIPANGQSFVSKSISRGPVKVRPRYATSARFALGRLWLDVDCCSCTIYTHVLRRLSCPDSDALLSCTGELKITMRLRAHPLPA
jgi:hypothetical protein